MEIIFGESLKFKNIIQKANYLQFSINKMSKRKIIIKMKIILKIQN
jgi:hypothetical protein